MTNTLEDSFNGGVPVFLKNKFNFLIFLAVLLTTLFGWFNPNSWSIILLAACRLFDRTIFTNIRNAFKNKVFLAYLIFFLVNAAGYLHTHNFASQGKSVAKEATFVAIAFAFCAGTVADGQTYRKMVTSYSLLLMATCVYCLIMAWQHYHVEKTLSVFFYQQLTAVISQNAVFFSASVLFGVIFLLSPYGEPAIDWLPPLVRKILRYALVLFFLGMIILLSSRLLMMLTLIFLINIVSRRYSYSKNKPAFLVGGSALFIAVCLLVVIDRPIRNRFKDMAGDLDVVRQDKFDPKMYFNSLQSRAVEYRFALQILNSRHAWLFGVSPGDSQDLLDQKYINASMDIGDTSQGPNRKLRGFIGFNFHNQYVESLVRCGIIGLASLLGIFIALISSARQHGSKETWFIILTIAILFIPEAPLTMQHGVFLFCFFPLMALSAPRMTRQGVF